MASDALSNLPEMTVSELSGSIKRTVEGAYERVRVRGELGRVVTARSGHMYLDMKDERAVLACVAWKGMAASFRFKPEEGLEVVAEGKLSTFAGQSKYQLIIDRLEPAGVGALMALLEERKKKLAAEGLFDEARKRPLPFLPGTIGVVTSPTGAVIRDILHRLADRFPVRVLVWPVLVQGDKAAEQVASAIAGFNAFDDPGLRPDLLIVARGGGSIEDLWAFNEEIVARAAAASEIPLISAIGHETDWTLIDFVSDYRAPTPTGAAEKAVPVRAEIAADIANFGARIAADRARRFERAATLLRGAARALRTPEALLSTFWQRADAIGARLAPGLKGRIATAAERYHRLSGRLQPRALGRLVEDRLRHADDQQRRAAQALSRNLDRKRGELAKLSRRFHARRPDLARPAEALQERAARLAQAERRLLVAPRDRLAAAFRLLEGVNPKGVLARGYALVHRAEGGIARRAGELSSGEGIEIEFTDGRAPAVVGGAPGAGGPKRGKARKPPASGGQGDLF